MSQVPSPIKFKQSNEKNVLTTDWPKHIPPQCPKCNQPLTYKVNLFHSRSRFSARLHAFAPWFSLVVITLFGILALIPTNSLSGGQGSPMAVVAMIAGPPVILTIIANGLKKVYKLQCHKCRFTKDFPKESTDAAHHQA